jgi:hypothetical protein
MFKQTFGRVCVGVEDVTAVVEVVGGGSIECTGALNRNRAKNKTERRMCSIFFLVVSKFSGYLRSNYIF